MVSHWMAWISVIFSILLLLKFAVRKCRIKKLNRIFSRLHESFAIIMFAAGLVHAIIVLSRSTYFGTGIISGILVLISALCVFLTCIHRKNHLKTWMKMHRIGTVTFAGCLWAHLVLIHAI